MDSDLPDATLTPEQLEQLADDFAAACELIADFDLREATEQLSRELKALAEDDA